MVAEDAVDIEDSYEALHVARNHDVKREEKHRIRDYDMQKNTQLQWPEVVRKKRNVQLKLHRL